MSAHASNAPDKARSALDGVEAFDYMVNLMREHVPQQTRIHYVITNGGLAPNVVPDFAEVYYYVRHPEATVVSEIWARIEDAALAERMREFIAHQIAASEEITPAMHAQRSTLFNRIRWGAGWVLVSVLDYTVTRRLNLGI